MNYKNRLNLRNSVKFANYKNTIKAITPRTVFEISKYILDAKVGNKDKLYPIREFLLFISRNNIQSIIDIGSGPCGFAISMAALDLFGLYDELEIDHIPEITSVDPVLNSSHNYHHKLLIERENVFRALEMRLAADIIPNESTKSNLREILLSRIGPILFDTSPNISIGDGSSDLVIDSYACVFYSMKKEIFKKHLLEYSRILKPHGFVIAILNPYENIENQVTWANECGFNTQVTGAMDSQKSVIMHKIS